MPTDEKSPVVIETISPEQAYEFFQAWKNTGKHTVEEAKAYLKARFDVEDSRKIPADQYEIALEWALHAISIRLNSPNRPSMDPKLPSLAILLRCSLRRTNCSPRSRKRSICSTIRRG